MVSRTYLDGHVVSKPIAPKTVEVFTTGRPFFIIYTGGVSIRIYQRVPVRTAVTHYFEYFWQMWKRVRRNPNVF